MAIIDISLGVIIPKSVIGNLLNIEDSHHKHAIHHHHLSSHGSDYEVISDMLLQDDFRKKDKITTKTLENTLDGSNSVKRITGKK